MKAKVKRITLFICLLSLIVVNIESCLAEHNAPPFDVRSISSFRDIPGVTDEEIAAIEAIKSSRQSFTFGSFLTLETFVLPDGTYAGFTAKLRRLLTELFGIPFLQEILEWDYFLSGLAGQTIDFTGDLTPTPERMRDFFMTHPIAGRSFSAYMLKERTVNIQSVNDLNGLTIGFPVDAVISQFIKNVYPVLTFEAVYINHVPEVVGKLISGEIDAFITLSGFALNLVGYDFITDIEIFPLVYTPVSLTTSNPDLEPIISVMNKYLAAGGIHVLSELYRTGRREYSMLMLSQALTAEEKTFIANLIENNIKVPIALEYDHYPISFFNNVDNEFQGIAPDIFAEISLLTGINFEIVNGRNTPWHIIFEMLNTGEAAIVSDLMRTEERQGNFLWADESYLISRYAFLSRTDLPHLEFFQIPSARTGVRKGSAFEEMYRTWFPNDTNLFLFASLNDALDALEWGEIDLVLAADVTLLFQTNFREKSGFKINYAIDMLAVGSYFGFNKNQEILRSIISKAQRFVETGRIARDWTSRVFDYSIIVAEQRFFYLTLFVAMLLVFMAVLVILLIKNNQAKILYKTQAATLSAIYKSFPDHVYSKDINGAYTSSNHVFEKFHGYTESELIGKTVFDIFKDKALAQHLSDADKQVLTEKKMLKEQMQFTHRDGTKRYMEYIKVPLIEENVVTGLLGISRDITELKEGYDRFDVMLNATPLICNLWSKDYEVIDCNDEALKMFEMDKQEYMDKFLQLAPEYQPDGQRSADKARDLLDIAFNDGRCVFEWMNQKLDGTLIPMEVTVTRVAYRGGYAAVGYGRDLRLYKKMMNEIEHQNKLLETVNRVSATLLEPDIKGFENCLFTAMSMMAEAIEVDRVCIWKNYEKDGRLFCTLAYEWLCNALMQRGNVEPGDLSYDDIIPGLYETLMTGECLNKTVQDMMPVTQAHMVKRGILSVFIVPIFMQENFWGFFAFDDCRKEKIFTQDEEIILRSVSRMMANALIRNEMTQNILETSARLDEAVKKANEANRVKSDFLAKMSHEIRTPMNAIIGMTELALREDMPNVVREYAVTVKQAGVNLLTIINDILDLSKIESGSMQIVPAEYSLTSLINDVVSIIKTKAVDSQIRFVVNLDSNLPCVLIGDETRIRQVLINLLGNAVKYTDEGHVSFSVYGEKVDDNAIVLSMEVKDSGRGIKQEDMGKLFQNFSQLDTESRKGIEGVGLGLVISRSFIQAMGGDITVESEYGKGSTFTVVLAQKIRNPEKLATVEESGKISALVYERRDVYAGSIIFAIKNLSVKCEHVTTDENFCSLVEKTFFSFIFISQTLFARNKDIILEFCNNSQIVLLAEFGEPVPAGNWKVLTMPVHAIPIANLFNGKYEFFSYNTNEELTARFTAPAAKVLVVDDINTNLKVASGLLLPYEMKVVLCASGAEAIKAVRSKDFDIVFMDHRMPDMDGVEATQRIRAFGEEDPYYKNLPIIALTANAISGVTEMFFKSGFDDYLSKPIDTVKLNTVLEKWIPKEKQINPSAVSVYTSKPPDVNITIEGLNTNNGIYRSGGKVELYFETLTTFIEDVLERKNEIKKCLDADNLPLYVTYIHALKSAAANIGGDKLSEAAHALEMAGVRGDANFIKMNNEEFLMKLEQLLNNISGALQSQGAKIKKTGAYLEPGDIKAELIQLKSALEIMDINKINRAVDIFQSSRFSGHLDDMTGKISKHIFMAEYDEAGVLIKSLLNELHHE